MLPARLLPADNNAGCRNGGCVAQASHDSVDLRLGDGREARALRPHTPVLAHDGGRRELPAVRQSAHEVVVDVGLRERKEISSV